MAKSPTIGANLKLDGEKEFKRALSDINLGLKVNQTELSLTSAEYANNGKSVESLTAKTSALQNQIHSQTEKVRVLEQALKASADKYGEGDRNTLKWQASLNEAKTSLAKMNSELDNNQKELEETQNKTTSLGDIVNNLSETMGVKVPPQMQSMVGSLEKVNASGALLVGTIAGIVTGLAKTTIETSKVADDILTLSSTSGIATDKLQEMNYASELLDVSVETMNGSMTKLIRNMNSAKGGSKEQADAFRKLHVVYKDTNGQLKDSNEVFFDVIDSLGKVKNETERDALAMTVFGKSARELNPLIEQGSARLKELGEEAHQVGYVMDEETLQSFGQLDDSLQRLEKQSDTFKNSMAQALLPVLTSLFEAINKIPLPVLQTVVALAGTIVTIILVVKSIKSATDGIGGIIKMFSAWDTKTLKTTAIIMGAVLMLTALALAIAAIIGKSGDFESSMNSIGNTIGKVQNQTSTSNLPNYALGTSYHRGGFARVNDRQNDPNSGEIIDLPTGSRVYPASTRPTTGGDVFNISIDAKNVKEFNDIVRMANEARQMRRKR